MGAKADAARLVTWRPDLRAHFERLNREWIERWFVVEDADRAVFADPGGTDRRARWSDLLRRG